MITAYCVRSWAISTWRTTGTWPMTCPPNVMETVSMAKLRAPIVYLRLHGLEGQPFLYGGPPENYTAISAEQVRAINWDGSIIFMEGCYGAEFAVAFLNAGAIAAVGCNDPTFGRSWRMGPSSLIGQTWLRGYRSGLSVDEALTKALERVDEQYRPGWLALGDTTRKADIV